MGDKFYPVFEDIVLRFNDIKRLLLKGYTHYRFPDNKMQAIWKPKASIKGVVGMTLIFYPSIKELGWLAVTSEDWKASRRPYELYKEKQLRGT